MYTVGFKLTDLNTRQILNSRNVKPAAIRIARRTNEHLVLIRQPFLDKLAVLGINGIKENEHFETVNIYLIEVVQIVESERRTRANDRIQIIAYHGLVQVHILLTIKEGHGVAEHGDFRNIVVGTLNYLVIRLELVAKLLLVVGRSIVTAKEIKPPHRASVGHHV